MSSTLTIWSCNVAGCPTGNYCNDGPGASYHQATYGHAPVPGRPLAWLFYREDYER
jgi:hypothetical protein